MGKVVKPVKVSAKRSAWLKKRLDRAISRLNKVKNRRLRVKRKETKKDPKQEAVLIGSSGQGPAPAPDTGKVVKEQVTKESPETVSKQGEKVAPTE